jgi:hypothetical protein
MRGKEIVLSSIDRDREQQLNWRDHLPIHPAAELFPLMSEAELRELGEDIKKHGLSYLVTLWRDGVDGKLYLLDGRNRLDAMEKVGIKFFMTMTAIRTPNGKTLSHTLPGRPGLYALKTDPYAFVLSANIARRHLTADQKRDLIAKVLKATPDTSNRQIAKQVKADDKTVAKVRADLESRSEIPNVKERTDTKGRKQPAKRKAADRRKELENYRSALIIHAGQAADLADMFNVSFQKNPAAITGEAIAEVRRAAKAWGLLAAQFADAKQDKAA